jgi:predicted dithiol-disulfide oxidoreductase (DUF899 family)
MAQHRTASRDEWLAARRKPLVAEKEHMREGDELARRRLELPWVVHHTYPTYNRGVEQLMGTYRMLDLAPLGRNEEGAASWWQRHDEYETARKEAR